MAYAATLDQNSRRNTFFSVKSLKDLGRIELELLINGELRQKGNTKDMVFDVQTLADYMKIHFPVCPGGSVCPEPGRQ